MRKRVILLKALNVPNLRFLQLAKQANLAFTKHAKLVPTFFFRSTKSTKSAKSVFTKNVFLVHTKCTKSTTSKKSSTKCAKKLRLKVLKRLKVLNECR